ncbi:hypothetical protein GZH47_13225 [Paenibacillus rhizovicinus]|uniref:Uncharacterized protein n=1 Tax=Paenibacillus rhizovicinus TaxID=2704463 RepID=A0A6C0P0G0_9BACL|nr:hypothetical protein [Paenibacillus rhizovicinus]QHW31706.1 hypothetical protein GZH47_13225 [Paenibacillus rhizovicinus]
MYEIAGCTITLEQMQRWAETFLPRQEPFYIHCDYELTGWLQSLGLPVYDRAQFLESAGPFIGQYGANYHHWRVPAAASIVILEAARLADRTLTRKLYAHQVALGRGQVYAFDWVKDIGVDVLEHLKESHGTEKDHIILTYDAWMQLSEEIQVAWLLKWLLERVEPMAVSIVEYGNIPERSELAVREHVSSFPLTSGANCFSATAGAYLGEVNVIENWMDVKQFIDSLCRESLTRCDTISQEMECIRIRPHDVLVWENVHGDAVHAAYAVTNPFVFNKMGQFWFQPWQYVRIDQIMDYAGCLSNGGCIGIYRVQD